jgi:hypothetical protein
MQNLPTMELVDGYEARAVNTRLYDALGRYFRSFGLD